MSGRVVWITGISGAGKTTVAVLVAEMLRNRGLCVALLDGDEIRQTISDDNCGHSPKDRLVNAYRISRLAQLLAGQGICVVVATMSLFHEIHEFNRRKLSSYFEVLLDISLETADSRDPKGLYERVKRGEICNLAGVDIHAQLPESPDLVLANDIPGLNPQELAESIVLAAFPEWE